MVARMRRADPDEGRVAAVLAAIGAWNALVPYLGKALGLSVDVAATVEVVDHVLPGLAVLAAGWWLRMLARRGPWSASPQSLPAAIVCVLGGLWVVASHVPLLVDAADDQVDWGAAIWHSLAGLPIVVLGLWCVVRS